MPYHATAPKPDDPSIEKYFYVCQTKGCGDIINPAFPVGLKNPSPIHCKFCQDKKNREIIEKEYASHAIE